MHPALRSSLLLLAVAAIAASLTACNTYDRRVYSYHQDKNVRVPDPFAASTSKAADEATSNLNSSPEGPGPMAPVDSGDAGAAGDTTGAGGQ
jgi:hypothetical protein